MFKFPKNFLKISSPKVLPIQVRHKGNILPHKKPRWIGPAPSKMFINPPKYHAPEAEIIQRNLLHFRYNEHFSALTQFLYEDYLRNSDVGDAAVLEAKKEEDEHKILLEENERENERVLKLRKERLRKEMEERKVEIEKEKAEFFRQKEMKEQLLSDKVRKETEALKFQITEENLEKSIIEALDNPEDPEYAIDLQGHIYRGRYTRSKLVPEHQLEKIPVSEDTRDFLRHEKQESEETG